MIYVFYICSSHRQFEHRTVKSPFIRLPGNEITEPRNGINRVKQILLYSELQKQIPLTSNIWKALLKIYRPL